MLSMRLPVTVICSILRPNYHKLVRHPITSNTSWYRRAFNMSTQQMIQQMTPMRTDLERLSDTTRVSSVKYYRP